MKSWLILLLSAVLLSVAAPAAVAQSDEPVSMLVDKDDPALNAAVRAARASLPVFWARFEESGAVRATAVLKVDYPTANDSHERLWVDNITRRDGVIRGTIANDPVDVPDLKYGTEVVIDPRRITDWGYRFEGRLWGYYSTRALLDRMPASERARIQEMLSPQPLEGADI